MGGVRSLSPAAEFAEQIFVRRGNPFRDRKLFLRVPSTTVPSGDDGHCEAFAQGNTIQFQSEANLVRSQPC